MAADEPWRLPRRVGSYGKATGPTLSPYGKARLGRIARRTPEVMVKMSGRTRNAGHLKQHLDYVTRNGKLRAETSGGHVIHGRDGLRYVHDDWLAANEIFQRARPNPNAAQSASLVLSMPPGTDPDRVQDAARAWAHANLTGNYDWLMVRHDDQEHPHVHITVRAVGHDGKRLAPSREQMQVWREDFAHELRFRGVDAEATPRPARGLEPARQRSNGLKRQRKQAQEPRKPVQVSHDRQKRREAWSARLEARQTGIRAAYLAHAAALANGTAHDQQLARDTERFVAGLPVARARREELARELEQVRDQMRGRSP